MRKNLLAATAVAALVSGAAWAQDASTDTQGTNTQQVLPGTSDMDTTNSMNTAPEPIDGTAPSADTATTDPLLENQGADVTAPGSSGAGTSANQMDTTNSTTTDPGATVTDQSNASDSNVVGGSTAENEALLPTDDATTTSAGSSDVGSMAADELVGTDIVDQQGNSIGEVADVVRAADGQRIDRVLVDVGGFLGIGERTVGIAPAQLQMSQGDGGDLVTSMTREQIEGLQAYEQRDGVWGLATTE